MNILVLAAHPDDETIGAGGTIARLAAAGHKVFLWVATEIYEPIWPATQKPPRRAETEKAAEILGVSEIIFAQLPTMNLAAMPPIDLSNIVSRAVSEFHPELILCPPPADVNSDHSAVFDIALVAARGLPDNPIRALYAYEIQTTTRFAAPDRLFQPTTYVDVTDTFARKLEAFAAYETEKRAFPHPRSPEGLEILAKERGLACGFKYAEAFACIIRRFHSSEPLAL